MEMKAAKQEVYAVPVYKFESRRKDAGPERPDSDDEERIVVKLYERQSGRPSITAYHRSDADGSSDQYQFVVTDTRLQKCAYRGDPNDLPVDIQHAVHAFGYEIKNLTTLGNWFTYRLDAQDSLQTLNLIRKENNNPLIRELAEMALGPVDVLDKALVLRRLTTENEFEDRWDDCEDKLLAEPLTDINDLIDNLEEHIHDLDGERFTGAEGVHIKIGVESATFTTQDSTYVAVHVFTDFGIQRVLFREHGDDEVVYLPDSDTDRPNSFALKYLRDTLGYTVKNVRPLEPGNDLSAVTSMLEFTYALYQHGFTEEPNHFANYLTEMAFDRVAMLHQAFVMLDKDSDRFHTSTANLLDHLEIDTSARLHSLGEETLVEMLSVVTKLFTSEYPNALGGSLKDTIVPIEAYTTAHHHESSTILEHPE